MAICLGLATGAALAKGGGRRAKTHPHANPAPQQAARPSPGSGQVAAPGAVRTHHAGDIAFGKPIRFHNISIVPVTTTKRGPFQRYTLLETGLAKKTLEVREVDGNAGQAQVSAVEVRNRGKDPVYLLGGEMILGGKQDRIIAQDTVVPASGDWTQVGVFCVEQGRWHGQTMKFASGKAMADISIRRAAMSGDQSKVWSEVAKKNVLHHTTSSTHTYRRTIQNAALRKKIRPYVRHLEASLPKNQRLAGLVFGINGKIHVADIFGNPVLFDDLSEKLLSAYVLEALGHQTDRAAKPVSPADAQKFITKGRKAKPKSVGKSGRARNLNKEGKDFIGAETVDEKSGEAVRETYIGK